MRRWWVAGAALLVALVVPAPAYANMGPPSLLIAWGLFWIFVAELVIVLVEAPVLWRMLDITPARGLVAALACNVLSTVLGFPPTSWVVVLDLPLLRGDWFGPFQTLVDILAAVTVFFVCSFIVEWPVVKLISRRAWKSTAVAVAVANVVSHAGLAILLIAMEAMGV